MDISTHPYANFDGQYIAGSWRAGRHGGSAADNDPYTGETLTEIALGNLDDLDEAYQAAEAAQRDWAAQLPAERAAVMLSAVNIIDQRHDEIIE